MVETEFQKQWHDQPGFGHEARKSAPWCSAAYAFSLLLVPSRYRKYPRAMILQTIPEVARLTAAEKLLLVSELWDDLAANPTEVPISREVIAELDRRMMEYRRDPSKTTTWEVIQQRLLGKTLHGE